jgi:hypothetical protein
MNRDEIVLSAALQVGLTFELPPTKLFEFAELIAAAEREKFEKLIDELTNKSLHAQLNAIAAEREACADIAENWRCNGCPRTVLADQIRARGRE